MTKLVRLVLVAIIACGFAASLVGGDAAPPHAKAAVIPWPEGLPRYDHIVIVVEENKNYEQIIDNARASYINSLRKEGANFTQMFAEEHYSQGNYFWLFSGSNQNVGFYDKIPSAKIRKDYPFKTPNLGAALIARGFTFKGYAEDLPAVGSEVEYTKNKNGEKVYARKHVPWVSFEHDANNNNPATSWNLRFADFPADFAKLPTVAFVIPNLENDMHNGKPDESIPRGDKWLKDKIDPYYQWAKNNNSLLIVTWDECDDIDENDKKSKPVDYGGLTNPFVKVTSNFTRNLQNRIATIFAGAHIKPGDYAEDKGITHVNILRTLEAMYGLPKAGAQQPNAAGGGISDEYIITDVFLPVKK